jgi:hypothetical protein
MRKCYAYNNLDDDNGYENSSYVSQMLQHHLSFITSSYFHMTFLLFCFKHLILQLITFFIFFFAEKQTICSDIKGKEKLFLINDDDESTTKKRKKKTTRNIHSDINFNFFYSKNWDKTRFFFQTIILIIKK